MVYFEPLTEEYRRSILMHFASCLSCCSHPGLPHLRQQNYLDLIGKLKEIGIAMVDVPGDGNCLIWSLLCLIQQDSDMQKFRPSLQQRTRSMLAEMWMSVANNGEWQKVFKHLCADEGEAPATPKKSNKGGKHKGEQGDPKKSNKGGKHKGEQGDPKKSNKGGKHEGEQGEGEQGEGEQGEGEQGEGEQGEGEQDDEPTTPPYKPDRPLRVVVSGNPKPVSLGAPSEKPAPKLKTREQAASEALVEPVCPDLTGMYDSYMEETQKKPRRSRKRKSKEKQDEPEEEDQDQSQDEEVVDMMVRKRRREKFPRACKSRPLTEEKRRQGALKLYLAKRQLSYGFFLSFHSRAGRSQKSGGCDQGFKKMQVDLLQNKLPECVVCQRLLEKKGITLEALEEALEEPADLDAGQQDQPKDQHGAPEEDAAAASGNVEDDAKDDAEDDEFNHLEAIRKYMKTLEPVIELLENGDGTLNYRCTICTTKQFPDGRINMIPRVHFKTAKSFIEQHTKMSQKHQQQLAKMNQNKEEKPVADSDLVQCEGYCVSSEDSPGILNQYFEEYKLWATHSQLNGNASHKYWSDATNGHWYVRHVDCLGKVEPGVQGKPAMCSKCLEAGDARGVVRAVQRFITKFFLAIFLNKKIFGSADDVKKFQAEVAETTFGQRNKKHWDGKTSMPLSEMQRDVRRSWQSMNDGNKTQTMDIFIGSVVTPCMKINVGAVNPAMASLSMQFVNALASRRLNVPWHFQLGLL